MYDQECQFGQYRMTGFSSLDDGARIRDDDVSQVERMPRGLDKRGSGGGREGENICRGIHPAELPVEPVDLLVVGDDDSYRCACQRALVTQRCRCSLVQAGPVNLIGKTRSYLNLHVESCVFLQGGYTPS